MQCKPPVPDTDLLPRCMTRRSFLGVAGATLLTAGDLASGRKLFRMTTARADSSRFSLTILHINDLHSRIEPVNDFTSTCKAEDASGGTCYGGVARLATKVRERRDALRSAGRHVITLDAGDQFQGSLFYTAYKGQAEVEFMNRIGFDAMALGNHEFDDGPDVLADFIAAAAFPVISGNTVVAPQERLAEGLGEWAIVELASEAVGVLSVVTPRTAISSSPGPNVTFRDEIAYLSDAVGRIRRLGIDKVVLLSHVGFDRDQEIAASVEGIAAIIGGHSHTLLSNSVQGAPAYATLVENPRGKAVPIVQAYAYAKYLGEISLAFDADGYIAAAEGDTILLDASVEPDPQIASRIAMLGGPIEKLKTTPVAVAEQTIDGSRQACRSGECEMGNLVADAILARVGDQGYAIAIHNGGGLRASIGAGTITFGDVLTALPFQNTIATMKLSGADIVAALEAGVSGVEEGRGGFPQVAGLRFSYDRQMAPHTGRIRSVDVLDNERWVPIDPDRIYSVATHSFLRRGSDGYEVFATRARDAYDFGPGVENAVAEYLAANTPFTPRIDGRITEVSGKP
jgi:5'-nucleotidase / UDP-sugar diphosphatase